MLLELARPVALLGSLFSLLAVFHSAFLAPATDFEERLYGSFGPLLLAAGIALISGLIFRAGTRSSSNSSLTNTLLGTFPVQVFCWTTGIMLVLFVLSWYLETHCIFYKDVRF
jgi:hypothetical protein